MSVIVLRLLFMNSLYNLPVIIAVPVLPLRLSKYFAYSTVIESGSLLFVIMSLATRLGLSFDKSLTRLPPVGAAPSMLRRFLKWIMVPDSCVRPIVWINTSLIPLLISGLLLLDNIKEDTIMRFSVSKKHA